MTVCNRDFLVVLRCYLYNGQMGFSVCLFVDGHHLFISIFGQWHKKTTYSERVKSFFQRILKAFQRRTKEQPARLRLPEDVPVFVRRVQGPATVEDEWEHRSPSVGDSTWILSLDQRESDIKRRRLRRDSQRDRNQNEKWGTRLKDCTLKERKGER